MIRKAARPARRLLPSHDPERKRVLRNRNSSQDDHISTARELTVGAHLLTGKETSLWNAEDG